MTPPIKERRSRILTDEDVEALVNALGTKLKQEFYQDLGRGLFAAAKKAVIAALIGLAFYGAKEHIQ